MNTTPEPAEDPAAAATKAEIAYLTAKADAGDLTGEEHQRLGALTAENASQK